MLHIDLTPRGTRVPRAVIAVAALGLNLLMSGPAHAASKQLALPYFNQTESNWCSLASAEMLLGYYGSSIQQCEIANYDFGQTNCCSNPGSSACNPSSGAFTGTPISYYGLSYSQWPNNQFSFNQFKSELDAGRPVSIGWSWSGGGGHAMNVGGYNTSGSYLQVYDPFPGAGCPGGEDTCWMTYTAYMGGSSYNHTAQAPLYNIVSNPVCSSDYFDLPGSKMQQCYDTWTHRNRYPVALTATSSNGSILYSGSYQTRNGSSWYQYTGMSASAYQSTFNSLANKGYRPAQVHVIQTASGWQYNAIWQKAEGAFYSYTGMSQSTFNSYHSSLSAQGYVLVDLFGYNNSNNTPYFAATWVKTSSSGQFPTVGTLASQYQSLFDYEVSAGRRPERISAYKSGGSTYYAVLWQNNYGVPFYSDSGWSESSFAADNAAHTADGLHLRYVSALNNVFSGVWTP